MTAIILMCIPKSRCLRALLTALFLFWATMSIAQSIKSPEVHSDGTVTFRLLAPAATRAEVYLELASGMSTLAMSKDTKGLWSVTSAALKPDLYSYKVAVDGLE